MTVNNSGNIPSVSNTAVVGTGTGFSTLEYTSAPLASKLSLYDSNANLSANAFIPGYTTSSTSGSLVILTAASTEQQYFTGVLSETVQLPIESTLANGQSFIIVNNSTNIVTVTSSGSNVIQAMAQSTQLVVTVINNTITTAAAWNASYSGAAAPASVVITGDSGTISGSALTIYSNRSALNCGATVFFSNSATTSTLNVSDANNNIMIGPNCGNLFISGTYNTALGFYAGYQLTTGSNNFLLGETAGYAIQDGSGCIAIGQGTFHSSVSDNNCIAIGLNNLAQFNGGSNIVSIGYAAGFSLLSSAGYDLFLGYEAGVNNTSGGSNIYLNNQGTGASNETHALRIGQATGTGDLQLNSAYISGIYGNSASSLSASNVVVINSSDQLGNLAFATAATANTLAERNGDANLLANNFIPNLQVITTAGATTTLTVASPQQTEFIGTLNQTCVLPDATTLTLGQSFIFLNDSTGSVTVNYSDATLAQLMSTNTKLIMTADNLSSATGYDIQYANSFGTVINTDSGSANGDTILFTGLNGANNSGATCRFSGSGSTVVLNLSDGENNNIFLGTGAGNLTYSGLANTSLGNFSFNLLTSGGENCALGYSAGGQLLSGSNNLYAGFEAGYNHVAAESSNVMLNCSGVASESNTLRIGNATGTGDLQLNSAYICGINGNTVSSPLYVTIDSGTDQLGVTSISPTSPALNVQVFSTPGSFIYTRTAGMAYCTIEVVGGGAGGGGVSATLTTQAACASGGGGGGYARLTASAATIGVLQTIVVGAGGAGGIQGTSPPGDGGITAVGSICVAGGGLQGTNVTGASASLTPGGAGGVGTTGDFIATGSDGGGGLGFGSLGVGFSGGGGGSYFAGSQSANGGPLTSAGTAGYNYGGGGGGAINIGVQPAVDGGAGSGGIVIITEYI